MTYHSFGTKSALFTERKTPWTAARVGIGKANLENNGAYLGMQRNATVIGRLESRVNFPTDL